MDMRYSSLVWIVLCACGPAVEVGEGGGGGSGASDDSDPETLGEGASDSGDGTSGGEGSTGAGSIGLPEACGCRVADESSSSCDEQATTSCAGEVLCPELSRRCGRVGPDMYACSGELVYDEAALECGLKALAAGAPGRLLVQAENTSCGLEGCGDDRYELTITGPDLVVQSLCESSPISAESSVSSLRSLQPPTYFEECLTRSDPGDRWTCLWNGLGEPDVVCAPE